MFPHLVLVFAWLLNIDVACLKRAQEALGDLKAYPVTTYEDWVHQECINRYL